MAAMPLREQNARLFLGIAATLGVLGIAFNLNGNDDSTFPKLIAAAGLLTLVWSIHRYGRLGPDEPIAFTGPEDAPKKKKKKKKKPLADEPAAAPPEG